MIDESELIPIRSVFTQCQIVAASRLLKKYNLSFIKRDLKIKRCDSVEIVRTCNFITLRIINSLLKKVEAKYLETKNMTIKESFNTVKKMKEDVNDFLQSTRQNKRRMK